MPELPEVEAIKKGLEKEVKGQRILSVQVLSEKIVASNSNIRQADKSKTNNFIQNIKNRVIVNINRRAKNIIIELDNQSIILIHLKMTGQLIYSAHNKSSSQNIKTNTHNKHTHIIFELENGILYYNDMRQFGYVLFYHSLAEAIAEGHFQKLGLEPLESDFTLEYFKNNIRNKKNKNKILKSVLLEQKIVVGLGNIYVDEVCYASNISPHRTLHTLSEEEINILYQNIKSILTEAIENGGSSISDYKLVNGASGLYQNKHQVYNRAQLPCYNCQTPLNRSIISGRSTIHCPTCQR